jgi:predicted TIM-barrel fold metal-dependent hydrolase
MNRIDQWFVPQSIYDAHCHYFGYSTLERMASQRGFASVETFAQEWNFKGMSMEIPPIDPHEFAKRWIRELDDKGCDKAVLFPEFNQLSEMKIAVEDYPDRFIPYLMINPVDEKVDALAMLEEAYSQVDIRGFKLYPPLHYFHAYDERIIPFYEFAQDNNLCITFHFGISVGAQADIRFMNPADLSPIARDFSKINFLLAHFATGYLKEMLFLMYHVDNVFAESSSSNAWLNYLPYDLTLHQVFKKIIDIKGAEKIVFGTDSSFLPRGWRKAIYTSQLAVCNHLGLSQEQIDQIFWKNTQNLMNL